MPAFAWGNRSIVHRNLIRSLDLSVAGGAVSVGKAATHNGASRTQPSVVFHPGTNRFILAYREQNYLTSIPGPTLVWNSSSGWPAAAQIPVTTHTAPALVVDRSSGRLTGLVRGRLKPIPTTAESQGENTWSST